MNILFVISNAFAYGTMDPSAYLINNTEFESIYISPVAKDQNYNIQMQGMGGQPQVYWGTDPNHMNAMPVISGSPSGGIPSGKGMNSNFMANPSTGAMMSGPVEPLQPVFEASPSQSAAVAQGEMMTPGTTGQSQGAVTGMGVPPLSETATTSSSDKKGSSSDKSSSSSSNKNSKNSKSSSSSKDKKNGTASVSLIVGLFGVILCTLLA